MGYAGAVFSDLAMQFFGLASVAALVPAVIWGFFFFTARGVDKLPKRAAAWLGGALLAAAIAGCTAPPETWPLPTGLGGVFGDMVLKIPAAVTGQYPGGMLATILAALLAAPTLWLSAFGAGLLSRENGFAPMTSPRRKSEPADDDNDDEDSEGILALGAITHWWLSARSFVRRRMAARRQAEREVGDIEFPAAESRFKLFGRSADARIEPEFSRPSVREPVLQMRRRVR